MSVIAHERPAVLHATAAAVPPLLPTVGHDTRTPLLSGGCVPYANLDVAATAPALRAVLDHVLEVLPYYGSVHRGSGLSARVSTELYEGARHDIRRFVGARDDDVVVFTRNTTDALNLLARALPAGASVVHLDVEHHANLLPWRDHDVRVVVGADSVSETLGRVVHELSSRPAALLTVTGASNVTGESLPLQHLAATAHRFGARLAVDAAQLAPHRPVDIATWGVDYVALSGHKLYAPFGAGALVGRRDWLDAAPAYLAGGGAVREVTAGDVSWLPSPARHEGGTPNLVGAVALAAAARTLGELPPHQREDHERALWLRLEQGLATIRGVQRLRLWSDSQERVAVSSFVLDGYDSGLLAAVLSAEHGVGVRDGRFCAHPALARISPTGTAVRASIGVGTSSEDVDRLLAGVRAVATEGPQWRYEHVDGQWQPVDDPRDLDPLGRGGRAPEADQQCGDEA